MGVNPTPFIKNVLILKYNKCDLFQSKYTNITANAFNIRAGIISNCISRLKVNGNNVIDSALKTTPTLNFKLLH